MGFSDRQVRALQRNVAPANIRMRVSDGKELSYVEGWFIIAQANRIFGFDGWDRETVEAKCIQAREARGTISVLYTARVRVTVRSGERSIVRDGCGTGEGRGSHLGESHDLALKAAETDATKRALVTFGKAFGLTLYSPDRRHAATRQNGAQGVFADPSTMRALRSKVDLANTATGGASGGSLVSDDATKQAAVADPPPSLPGPAVDATPAPDMYGPAVPGVGSVGLSDRIDKSVLTLGEPRRLRDKNHLRHVASQACLVCSGVPADAHHLRFAQPKALGRKVSDEFTVPLCRSHHYELHHAGNEPGWWHDMGIDPIPIARRLWGESRECDRRIDAAYGEPVEPPELATSETVTTNEDSRR